MVRTLATPQTLVGPRARLEEVAGEWEALAEHTGASPFSRPGWFHAWWKAFGKGSLEVVCARRDGRLVGVLPLRRRRGALASPTNWHTPEFSAVAEDDEITRALLESILRQGSRRVSLSFLDGQGATVDAFNDAANGLGYRVIDRVVLRSPYLAIDRTWEELEEARIKSKRRANLRRLRRGLEAEGTLSFEVSDGRDDLEYRLDEAFRVEALGWKGERGSAIASAPETRRFYTDVARWAAGRGWLRLCGLRLDGQLIAFGYCLEHGGVHYLMKVGFDPSYSRFAPGVLIRRDMLARAVSLGFKRYEFLGTDEPLKLEWTDTVHERRLVQAFRGSAPGLVDWAAFAYGRPVAKLATRSFHQ